MSSSDSEEETVLLLYALTKKKRARLLVPYLQHKKDEEYLELCRELMSKEDRFFDYFEMPQDCFEELHYLIKEKISKQDTNWRRAISTRERLAICLRYLTTGDSYQTIATSFGIGRSTTGGIVKNVCKELWNTLQPTYMPTPSEELWRQSEAGYREFFNFPNCLGSINGKHIVIHPKHNNVTTIVWFGIADPFYKFIAVDIGNYGSLLDTGIFENSSFYYEYIKDNTLLPPEPLPGDEEPVPHVFIGDESFILKEYLMRPFPKTSKEDSKNHFNAQLNQARRVVETSFDIMVQKFKIFNRPTDGDVDTAIHIVKAACILHNYLITSGGTFPVDQAKVNIRKPKAIKSMRLTNHRSTYAALQIRDKFLDYFNENVAYPIDGD